MPFLRFTRDKRGYEHTYLVQATNRRGKPIRPRILYWYRTPPGIRLGRSPFDAEVRRALEAQNPGIVFDWDALVNTPFPAQDPEYWRERRRQEKAAKQARREEEAADTTGAELGEAGLPEMSSPEADGASGDEIETPGNPAAGEAAAGGEAAAETNGLPRKRRRRGGRRRRARLATPEPSGAPAPASGEEADAAEAFDPDTSGEAESASEDEE